MSDPRVDRVLCLVESGARNAMGKTMTVRRRRVTLGASVFYRVAPASR